MRNKKKSLFTILVALIIIFCGGCGEKYTCSSCGEETGKAYYDPFSVDTYFCEECAKSYFAPFPYTSYEVK